MPSLKQLEEITKELRGIANEPAIMAKWGEKYEELPLPDEVPLPDVNVDDLLGGIGGDDDMAMPSELANILSNDNLQQQDPNLVVSSDDIVNTTDNSSLESNDFSLDDLLDDAMNAVPNLVDENDSNSAMSDENLEQIEAEAAANDEISLFTEALDIDSVSPENMDSTSNDFNIEESKDFDNMLSDLNLDENTESENQLEDLPEINNDFENPDVPEALLDGLGDMLEEARTSSDESSFPEFDIEDDSSNKDFADEASTSESVENLPDIETIAGAELPDIETIGELENSGIEDLSTDDDLGDIEELSSDDDLASLEELSSEDDFGALEDLDTNLDGIEEISADNALDDIEELASEDDFSDMEELTSDAPSEIDLSSALDGLEDIPDIENLESSGIEEIPSLDDEIDELDDISDLSSDDNLDNSMDMDNIGAVDDSFSSASDNFESAPNFDDVEIPDLDEHTAFAIDDNVLDTNMDSEMDEFAVPESFTDFSPDKAFKFHDDSEAIDEDSYEGKIPLSITEADYENLIDRISSFPLNVRLEVQDYLANGDDSELNKMEIVNLIVKNASLKKIVGRLEAILDKSIPIPKGFDKKSYEEYQKLKKTFKYRFVHTILPIATIAMIVLVIAFCLVFLSWSFIYKPIVAENIYNEGYGLIENGKYASAIEKFDEAGQYKKKRKWYFDYANAFRQKKQFLSAEAIYRRLLFDFDHDKEGGIEYADMLSKDLRNYEKAEKVLKRQVLDYHINDEQALLALGDTYLDWADENPEKYEDARKTYVSLIDLYGRKDIFLGRMMRYFIRTDNLAEVLPLKDHFSDRDMESDDLIELSGYLVEKRYNPKPMDSERLRAKIEDVRELLEKAIKSNIESPEANYNMGKFFIYNYKEEAAKEYLAEAINLYENSTGMTPRRMLKQIDSMRLYGELLAEDKSYNEAQEIYANALAKYEDYTAQKLVYPSELVGKLYEDYGNISYFISGDYDSALSSYEKALSELNNTPSIQYKIGYIHYIKENYADAMESMALAYADKPNDKNLLYSFGNTLFKRGDYYASQAYYQRLMEMLEAEKFRKGIVFPQTRADHGEFVEKYMHTTNNLGVSLNRLAMQNGDSKKYARAIYFFQESNRAWDALTRNPDTMIRSKTVNLAQANIQNVIKPRSQFNAEIYTDIPKTLENEKILQQLEDR